MVALGYVCVQHEMDARVRLMRAELVQSLRNTRKDDLAGRAGLLTRRSVAVAERHAVLCLMLQGKEVVAGWEGHQRALTGRGRGRRACHMRRWWSSTATAASFRR